MIKSAGHHYVLRLTLTHSTTYAHRQSIVQDSISGIGSLSIFTTDYLISLNTDYVVWYDLPDVQVMYMFVILTPLL